jgi:nucleotide-binding universal stress UspA family protein
MDPLKIVILTDFSPLSKMAVHYAIKMGNHLKAEYTILNVVRLDGVPKSNLRWRQIEKELLAVANEEGGKLLQELKGKTQAPVSFKAVKGHTVADVVRKYTEKNYTNLVVMGSQGASQLKKFRLGGTTVSVIDAIYSPVLAIPKLAEYKSFKRIVYATDLQNVEKELELIVPFAQIFGTHIHMVHVVTAVDKQMEMERKLVEEQIKSTGYSRIDFKLLIDDDISEAIDLYIQETKSDLLTTFTHELNLYEKLFGLSVTRKLAYQGTIPLLAFKRKK